MPVGLLSLLLLCSIALSAGFIQGLACFGSVLVALPLMLLFLDLKMAVPLAGIWAMTINAILVFQLRAHLRRQHIVPLIIAAMPGIPLGVFFLKHADARFLAALLGVLLVVFSLYFFCSGGRTRPISGVWLYVAGFCSGFLGGSLAMSGPPVIIYTTLQPWDKDEIKSTLTGYFFLSGLIIIVAQAISGLVTKAVLTVGLFSVPFILAGVSLGSLVYCRLATHRYRQVVVGLMTLLALLTLVKALRY
jgi:uncharacterized protein